MPIFHKNWEVIPGESLNFNIDYREGDHLDPDNLTAINLTNYTVVLKVTKRGVTALELTEPYDIYVDNAEGHIEISISPANIALITDSQPVSYAVYIYNDNDVDDTYAILRGRIKVTTSA